MVYNKNMRLSLDKQRHIDGVIELLQERTGLRYPDSSLFSIAEALDLEIYTKTFTQTDNSTEINGVIEYTGSTNPKAKIFINSAHAKNRKSFTIAHEMGHFLLHPSEEKYRVDIVDYSKPESVDETEANYFAASLLMPKGEFVKLVKLAAPDTEIAKYFGVSEVAVKKRKQWLRQN